jgi:hypothetical protein
MHLNRRPVTSLTSPDLDALVAGEVRESTMLDYKSELPGPTASDKKEFAADVSAMANKSGGIILYGITEADEDGVPREVVGLAGEDRDDVTLRLEAILRAGLEPGMTTAELHWIDHPAGPVLALGIPRSPLAPHRVLTQGSNRFWRRSSNAKYEPSVEELRSMFLETDAWEREVDEFRARRLEPLVASRHGPDQDVLTPTLVHVLPLGRLRQRVDVVAASRVLQNVVSPHEATSWRARPNLDGLKIETGAPDLNMQWFRFGGVEYFLGVLHGPDVNTAFYDASALDRILIEDVPKLIDALNVLLDTPPPYALGVTLARVAGRRFWFGTRSLGQPVDRDTLQLPLVVVHDMSEVASSITHLRDLLWQAVGLDKAPGPRPD